jgi:hypothetical protein
MGIGYGFFIPVFFVVSGMNLDVGRGPRVPTAIAGVLRPAARRSRAAVAVRLPQGAAADATPPDDVHHRHCAAAARGAGRDRAAGRNHVARTPLPWSLPACFQWSSTRLSRSDRDRGRGPRADRAPLYGPSGCPTRFRSHRVTPAGFTSHDLLYREQPKPQGLDQCQCGVHLTVVGNPSTDDGLGGYLGHIHVREGMKRVVGQSSENPELVQSLRHDPASLPDHHEKDNEPRKVMNALRAARSRRHPREVNFEHLTPADRLVRAVLLSGPV